MIVGEISISTGVSSSCARPQLLGSICTGGEGELDGPTTATDLTTVVGPKPTDTGVQTQLRTRFKISNSKPFRRAHGQTLLKQLDKVRALVLSWAFVKDFRWHVFRLKVRKINRSNLVPRGELPHISTVECGARLY